MSDDRHQPLVPAYQHGGSPAWLADPFVQCLVVIGIISVVFLAFPTLDIWFTRQFYDEASGFPVADLPAFIAIRELHSIMTWVIAVGLSLALIYKILLPWRPSLVPPRDILFVLGTLAVGPGIIVNGLFKSFSGRPRPYQTELFGGDMPFIGVWEITDHCARNCSFVSGEASSAIWLITAAVLFPRRWRKTAFVILLGLGIVFALNRVAFGGHFLSDVLIAWFLTLGLIALFERYLYASNGADERAAKAEEALSAFGMALRRPFTRG